MSKKGYKAKAFRSVLAKLANEPQKKFEILFLAVSYCSTHRAFYLLKFTFAKNYGLQLILSQVLPVSFTLK